MKIGYIICVLLLAVSYNMQANEGQTSQATILLITRPVTENGLAQGNSASAQLSTQAEEQRLERLIANSIKLTMERAGLQVILDSELDVAPTELIQKLKEKTFDTASIYRLAKQVQADFTLASSFMSSANEIELRFNWYNTQHSVLSKTIFKKMSLELHFDEAVSQTVSELLTQLKHELATVTPRKKATTTKIAQPVIQETNIQEISQHTLKQPEAVVSLTPPVTSEEKATYWELVTGFAPFMAIGDITDFFKLSYAPTLNVSYLINLSAGQLGLGIYTGFNVFQVEEIMNAGLNYFIPLGADLRFETNTKPLRFYVHAAGGPTILTINLDNTMPRSTLIAFALGGIGLCIPFGQHFGLALDSSFIVFFDHGTTIMGYMPCGALYFKQ